MVATTLRLSPNPLGLALCLQLCCAPIALFAEDGGELLGRLGSKFSSNTTYNFVALHKYFTPGTTNVEQGYVNIVTVNYGRGIGRKIIVPLDSPANSQAYIWSNSIVAFLRPFRQFIGKPTDQVPMVVPECDKTVGGITMPEFDQLFQSSYQRGHGYVVATNSCVFGEFRGTTVVLTNTRGLLTLCVDLERLVVLKSEFQGKSSRVIIEFNDIRRLDGFWIPFRWVLYNEPSLPRESFEVVEITKSDSFDVTALAFRIPWGALVADSRMKPAINYFQGTHDYTDEELVLLAVKMKNGEKPRIGRDAEAFEPERRGRHSAWGLVVVIAILAITVTLIGLRRRRRLGSIIQIVGLLGGNYWASSIAGAASVSPPDLLAAIVANTNQEKLAWTISVLELTPYYTSRASYALQEEGERYVVLFTNSFAPILHGFDGTNFWFCSQGFLTVLDTHGASFVPKELYEIQDILHYELVKRVLQHKSEITLLKSPSGTSFQGIVPSSGLVLPFKSFTILAAREPPLLPVSFTGFDSSNNGFYHVMWTNYLRAPGGFYYPAEVLYTNSIDRASRHYAISCTAIPRGGSPMFSPPKVGSSELLTLNIEYNRILTVNGNSVSFMAVPAEPMDTIAVDGFLCAGTRNSTKHLGPVYRPLGKMLFACVVVLGVLFFWIRRRKSQAA